MQKSSLFALFSFLLLSVPFYKDAAGQAPGCPDIYAGSDINLTAANNCVTLSADIFNVGATSNYAVGPINYSPPFPFTGGTPLFVGDDDVWSPILNLPFEFCMYGNTFSKIVVGANGIVTFDLSKANGYCEWLFNAPIPSPGPPPIGIYNNSISGAYHDMDPTVFLYGTPDINYAILGAAPCRSFVVNFNKVPQYDCNYLRTTQQIVLYETTNVIEVYINNKPTCTSWNNGHAVIGIQNANGTQGVTPPGRNTGVWSATNEAWRFTPSGPSITSIKWFDADSNQIGTGNTLSVCPTDTTTYTALGTYTRCNGTPVLVTDEITINVDGGFSSSITGTHESCANNCDGTLSISTSGGTLPFTFNIGNGPQSSPNFSNLCPGSYTVSVTDASGLTGIENFTVQAGHQMLIADSVENESCLAYNDGMIILTASGSNAPYLYQLANGSTNYNGTFSNLASGVYDYSITDANSCKITGSLNVAPGPLCCNMVSHITYTQPHCNQACDGSINLSQNFGVLPVQYSINNGSNFKTTGIYDSLCAGTYYILIRDALGCEIQDTLILNDLSDISVSALITDEKCGEDGAIDIMVSGGTSPFIFNWSNGSTSEDISTGLAAGTYAVSIIDADQCLFAQNFLVAGNDLLDIQAEVYNVSCNGKSDGSIDVIPSGGLAPYNYLWAGGQLDEDLSELSPGTYHISVSDQNDCSKEASFTISEPEILSLNTKPIYVKCDPNSSGILTDVKGGTPPYSYNWSSGETTEDLIDIGPDVYGLTITDASDCTLSDEVELEDKSIFDVTAGNDESLNLGDSIVLNPYISDIANIAVIKWSPAIGLSCTNCLNPTASPSETTVYHLYIEDEAGCTYGDEVKVEVLYDPKIYAPNAFTPNGDGYNDDFELMGDEIENIQLKIFNRWGQKIYESNGASAKWDGRFLGKMSEPGVYVYSAEITYLSGDVEFREGSITLLK